MRRSTRIAAKEREHVVAELSNRYQRMVENETLAKAVELLSFHMSRNRTKMGMRTDDLANVLGVSRATIARWENEPGRMTVEQLMTILYLLDVDPSVLRLPTR